MSLEFAPIFVTKGPLDPEKHKRLYIARQEDAKAMACISAGIYVALLGARQTGKTSLLYMLRHRLLKQGNVKVAMVDLSGSMYKPGGWYSFVCRCLLDELGVAGKPRERLLQDPDPAEFGEFLKVVATEVPEKKVILFDEIGAIPRSISEPFLWTIRHVYNIRHTSKGKPFAQYVFVLAGSYELQQLTKGKGTVSPFNISEKIYMTDLPWEGVRQLVQILGESGFSVNPGVDMYTYECTGGHPYLTQRLCSFLEAMGKDNPITQNSVDLAVAKIMEGDDCLVDMIDRLRDNSEIETRARRILLGGPMKFDRLQQEIIILELTGAISRSNEGNCVIRNRICEAALRRHFDMENTVPTSKEEPAYHKSPTSWQLRIAATVVAALLFSATLFFSKSWSKAVLSIPLLWLVSNLSFYLKDVKYRDNTSDPDRVVEFKDVTVQSLYDPVIKTNQEHSVLIQILHRDPKKVQEVIATLRPLSRNLGVKSEFSHTYTKPQESKEFTLVLKRKATLWALLFPFAEQQFVEFSAEVGNERRSGLIKLNADYTSSLIWSAIVSVAGLAVSLVDLASKIKGLLKP
jgi:hypothetical protein